MHVLMLVYKYFPDRIGGAERQCRKLADMLVQRGIRVTVVTGTSNSNLSCLEVDRGVTIVRVPLLSNARSSCEKTRSQEITTNKTKQKANKYGILSVWAASLLRGGDILRFMYGAWRVTKALEVDVIHAHTTTWLAGFAAWLGKRMQVPVICKETTMPAFPKTPPLVPFRRYWERVRMNNWYIAQHVYAARSIAAFGIPRERIFVIPNGVEFPQDVSVADAPKNIVFIGNMSQGVKDKGVDTLLTSWALLKSHIPSARLLFAGADDEGIFRRMAIEAGCFDGIEILGYVRDISNVLEKAAVVVIPSRREGMSNVMLEALSYGVPIVATNIPGNTAVLDQTNAGILVAQDDANAMCEAMRQLLSDERMRKAMRVQARMLIHDYYEIGVVADSLIEVYNRIVDC